MKKYYFLFLSILIFLASCQEDAEKPANNLLGSWQKVKVESKTGNNNFKEVVNQPCQLDDIEEYRPTGDWTLFSGPNQCSPGNGVLRGTWKQAASDTKIIYTYEGASGEYESTVQELTADKLILVQSTGALNGEQIRYTYEKK